jgi:hypothetical protein
MTQGNIEKIEPLYLAPSPTIRIQGEKVYRIDVAGLRHYIREKNGQTYKSLTTFLSAVMPKNRFLQSWREEMAADLGSPEKLDEWMEKVADYGTALHIAVADYCRNGYVNWYDFEDWAYNYLTGAGLKAGTLQTAVRELTKDFAGILQFFYDYDVRVIAVEIPVFISAGVATLVDLVVEMDEKNYQATPVEKRKRISAIINLKSGKSGSSFEDHILQLVGERWAFNETYSQSIVNVFNLSPSNWKETPSYKLTNHTKTVEEKEYVDQFQMYLQLAKTRGVLSEPTKTFPMFKGVTEYGENPTNALTLRSYNEFAQERISTYEKELTKDSTII